jgi:hypothetical protein
VALAVVQARVQVEEGEEVAEVGEVVAAAQAGIHGTKEMMLVDMVVSRLMISHPLHGVEGEGQILNLLTLEMMSLQQLSQMMAHQQILQLNLLLNLKMLSIKQLQWMMKWCSQRTSISQGRTMQ